MEQLTEQLTMEKADSWALSGKLRVQNEIACILFLESLNIGKILMTPDQITFIVEMWNGVGSPKSGITSASYFLSEMRISN